MLRVIVCEDNEDFMERIVKIINEVMGPYKFEYKIIRFDRHNKNLDNLILDKKDEKIYVLDVELPDISGLEIASSVREVDKESPIVFVTSHPECQNDIFYSRLLAVDYINKDRFWSDRFTDTVRYLVRDFQRRQVLVFNSHRNTYRIPMDKIVYVEKIQDNQKCFVYLDDDSRYEVFGNLSTVKESLGINFYQTHKSGIVNIEKIRDINYAENSITFVNGKTVYLLSNRNKKGLREYVSKY